MTEIRLTNPDLVLAPTIRAVPDLDIELESKAITGPGSYVILFQVSGDGLDRFDAAVRDDPTVAESNVVVETEQFRVYRVTVTDCERLVLAQAVEFGMRFLNARADQGGWTGTLETPDLDALAEFREYCAERDVEVSLLRLYQADDQSTTGTFGLTPQQHDAIVAAYRKGYFEQPRRTTLSEIAESLDISTSATSGRLQRGLDALVEHTVCRDLPDPALATDGI